MNRPDRSDRVQILVIPDRDIAALLLSKTAFITNLPPDARVERGQYSIERRGIELVISSETFDIVQPGMEIRRFCAEMADGLYYAKPIKLEQQAALERELVDAFNRDNGHGHGWTIAPTVIIVGRFCLPCGIGRPGDVLACPKCGAVDADEPTIIERKEPS